jgi:hypothetical protein
VLSTNDACCLGPIAYHCCKHSDLRQQLRSAPCRHAQATDTQPLAQASYGTTPCTKSATANLHGVRG